MSNHLPFQVTAPGKYTDTDDTCVSAVFFTKKTSGKPLMLEQNFGSFPHNFGEARIKHNCTARRSSVV